MLFDKILDTIIVVGLIIIVILLIALINPSIYVHFYYDNIAQFVNPNFHCISEEYNIYVEDILTQEYEEYLISYIKESIDKGDLYKNNYYIILTDNNIPLSQELPFSEYASGITSERNKVITINYEYIEWAFLHEIGHAVDNTYKFSETEELIALYYEALTHRAEAVEDIDIYMLTNIKEFFAENYKRYITNTLDDENLISYFKEMSTNGGHFSFYVVI